MKTKLLLLSAVILFSMSSYGQFTFGVSPGIGLKSAYFGYKVNSKIVPYFGFQYVSLKMNFEEDGYEYDYNLNQIVPYSYKSELKGSLFVPNLGVKYFFKQHNNLHAYGLLSISKPIIRAKVVDDGMIDEELEEEIKAIKLFGGELGFGVEYFFDDNFSIGGEFGFMYMNLKFNNTYDDYIYNPDTGSDEIKEREVDYKLNISPTYSRVSLNFYF